MMMMMMMRSCISFHGSLLLFRLYKSRYVWSRVRMMTISRRSCKDPSYGVPKWKWRAGTAETSLRTCSRFSGYNPRECRVLWWPVIVYVTAFLHADSRCARQKKSSTIAEKLRAAPYHLNVFLLSMTIDSDIVCKAECSAENTTQIAVELGWVFAAQCYAVVRCPSVCLSARHVRVFCRNE